MKLSEKHCIPCEGGVKPFGKAEVAKYLKILGAGWKTSDSKSISKIFKFKNFVETMGFVNQVALVAQAEDHHPDMKVSYKEVGIELSTHAIKGLSENDFVLAAKIDEL